ncbi:MAG: sugar-binding protein [Spirochaetaceae bacterium]|jgi:putative multiple sugar transport system substrate-binding protein|nr:sugar-binding protein [Spirochaetaceae bacterium]
MKKSILLVMLILAVASISFGQALIGLAMPETHVQRWVKDGASLKAEAEKRGYKAEVQFGNADQAQQNQQIQSFLTTGAKALIVGNINDGVRSVIATAKKDKVVVLAYDRIIQNSKDYDYFITFNNYKVGTLQGQSLAKALNLDAATAAAPKYITLFAGSITDANAFFFFDGAIDVLTPYINKGVLKVVGPYPKSSKDTANFARITTENWFASIAKARMEGLLVNDAAGVTLDAILAPNDPIARGVIEACKADAKYRGKLPFVTGQDAEFASVMSIKNGEQYMTVFKDTAKLAEAAVILIDQVLKGVKANAIVVPGAVLASGALKEIGNTLVSSGGKFYVNTYLLDPILITKDNIRVPVDAGFYTAAEAAQITR